LIAAQISTGRPGKSRFDVIALHSVYYNLVKIHKCEDISIHVPFEASKTKGSCKKELVD